MNEKETARLNAARKVGAPKPDAPAPKDPEVARIKQLPPIGQADLMRQADRETIALREQKAKDQKAEEEPKKAPLHRDRTKGVK